MCVYMICTCVGDGAKDRRHDTAVLLVHLTLWGKAVALQAFHVGSNSICNWFSKSYLWSQRSILNDCSRRSGVKSDTWSLPMSSRGEEGLGWEECCGRMLFSQRPLIWEQLENTECDGWSYSARRVQRQWKVTATGNNLACCCSTSW